MLKQTSRKTAGTPEQISLFIGIYLTTLHSGLNTFRNIKRHREIVLEAVETLSALDTPPPKC